MSKNIYTLTLSPALDKSTSVDQVIAENKLRCSPEKFEPGGGGINVSRALKKLGQSSIAVYPYGGHTGELFKDLLNKEGVDQIAFPVQNWTRENFIVVEDRTNRQFRFGMPAPALLPSEAEKILNLLETSNDYDYLVVSGSTPAGLPDNFYGRLSQIVHSKGARLVLDTSGEPLKEAMETAGIFMCKPNIGELSEIVGEELNTIPLQEKAAMKIIESGKIEVLVVSLGAFGAFMASKEGIYHVAAPSVHKKSTVGAGDSMVAGIVFSLKTGKTFSQAIKFGVACGTSATMNSGTELFKVEDVYNLYDWVDKHSMH
jgi:6-phosphofructokinase 2